MKTKNEAPLKLGITKVVTDAWSIAKRYLLSYFLFDILAVLPLPQVIVPIIFSQMIRGSNKKFLNAAILFQYVPRVLRICLSWRTIISRDNQFSRIVWVKAAFNFFLYIIASQVLGAFWYFFSIEREISCWHVACKNQIGCLQNSFNCDHTSGNHSFVNDYCSVTTPNTTLFDFGIFLEALQSGTVASKDFPKKFAYCFWWGLRNLSSLGQNLQTSTYIWENCFAVLLSIFGLLLFLYFIGNLQTYMLSETKKCEKNIQRLEAIIKNLKSKGRDVELWINKNKLPLSIKDEIISNMAHILDGNKEFDAEKPLLHLSRELRRKIKLHLCKPILRKMPLLENDEQLLRMICDFLKPVYYDEHEYVFREGEPLDAMLFITQGIVLNFPTGNCEGTLSSMAECIEKGDFYGQDLLDWAFKDSPTSRNLSKLPVSTKTLKTHTKVEGFTLLANDLMTVVLRKTDAVSTMQAKLRGRLRKKNKRSNL
ncbi:hypothetical protein ACB092_12G054900 [Castanea dentata]